MISFKIGSKERKNKRKRGRPLGSIIRQNIIDLLFVLKEAYGYEITKYYNQLFPKTTQRNIYYHLNKGVMTGEFKVKRIKQEQGSYSWGRTAEKKYYALGKEAKPNPSEKLIKEINKIKTRIKDKIKDEN